MSSRSAVAKSAKLRVANRLLLMRAMAAIIRRAQSCTELAGGSRMIKASRSRIDLAAFADQSRQIDIAASR
jgi:hypothetical protein